LSESGHRRENKAANGKKRGAALAVQPRHLEVGQQQIEAGAVGGEVQGRLPVVGGDDLEPGFHQALLDHLRRQRFVLGHEHAQRGPRHQAPRPLAATRGPGMRSRRIERATGRAKGST